MSSGRALDAGADELSRGRQSCVATIAAAGVCSANPNEPERGLQPNEPERVEAERTQTAVRNQTNPSVGSR